MNKNLLLCLMLAALLIPVSACNRVVYLEQETPPGTVPPPLPGPSQMAPAPSAPAPVPAPAAAPAAATPLDAPSTPTMAGPPPSPAQQDAARAQARAQDRSVTISRFNAACKAKKNPKIVVFLNRELSDSVVEWADPTIVTQDGSKKGMVGFRLREDLDERVQPQEKWMWAFEEAVLNPFLQSSAVMVDRAVIMRNTAAKSGKQDDPYAWMAVRKVEMDALHGAADVFAELLISADSSAPCGYEFKAQVKDVNSGQILANVTSLGLQKSVSNTRWVATNKGYEKQTETRNLALQEVAEDLALEVMDALSARWGK